jgi:hypothetical protein
VPVRARVPLVRFQWLITTKLQASPPGVWVDSYTHPTVQNSSIAV